MATPNVTSGERLELYQSLFLINRSFHRIVQRIEELEKSKKLKTIHFKELRGLAQEVQLHINNQIIQELQTVESAEWFRFGRVRTAMEKRLNPDRQE
jgi:hypothetical protein